MSDKALRTRRAIYEGGAHDEPFTIHSLRDTRASLLINEYTLDRLELTVLGGWGLSTTVGMGTQITPVMERYLYLQWQRPLKKLLKPLA